MCKIIRWRNTRPHRLKRLLRDGLFNLKVGDGKSLVDWIFVDNLTHALLLSAAVATASAHGRGGSARITVHVSDEDPREMNHLFCSFAEGLGYTPPSIRIPTALLARIATLMVTASRLCFGAFAPLLTPSEALKAGKEHGRSSSLCFELKSLFQERTWFSLRPTRAQRCDGSLCSHTTTASS